jgi:ResB-like family
MTRSIATRIFDGLASLRLAVVVMVTLGSTCAYATFYEMNHGTPAVQRDIYQTRGFAFLLGLLGVNIFSVMMKRYPWKEHHVGFVMAHIGILTLLAGSLISLHRGLDSNMPLYEGETTDRVTLLEKGLFVSVPGAATPSQFSVVFEKSPPGPGHEQRFPVVGSDVTLVAEDYAAHVEVTDSFSAGDEGAPALHFILQAPFATQDGWLSASPEGPSHVNFGPVSLAFHAAASEAEALALARQPEAKNQIHFVAAPGGALLYGAEGESGPVATGRVEIGKPIPNPMGGMALSVDQLLTRATRMRVAVPATPPAKEERRLSAVKIHLEGPSARTASEWLPWSDVRRIPFGSGAATVAYRAPEVAVPFKVTLLKFKSEKYPGSNMPATYESFVRVDDPESGVSEHHISMNHPMHYRGYIFFQASFVEGTPMMSIFSVARAPGLPLVYLGVTLIGAGVAWMFYLKPYLVRRQAARALAAHRERESRNEKSPADAVPGRSGRAQPASSGA